jgi:hypothetical protein
MAFIAVSLSFSTDQAAEKSANRRADGRTEISGRVVMGCS